MHNLHCVVAVTNHSGLKEETLCSLHSLSSQQHLTSSSYSVVGEMLEETELWFSGKGTNESLQV